MKWLSTILIGALLAAPQIDDMGVLRNLLGSDFEQALKLIDKWNQFLIRNTEQLAPAQAAELRRRTKLPSEVPGSNTLALAESNYGLGLVTRLFEEDFDVVQINLIFCDDRAASLQVLFDDSRTFGNTAQLLGSVYGMGPSVPFGSHTPAVKYPLPGVTYTDEGEWQLGMGASPVVVWDMGLREGLYQPVGSGGVILGQFWLTHGELAKTCGDESGSR